MRQDTQANRPPHSVGAGDSISVRLVAFHFPPAMMPCVISLEMASAFVSLTLGHLSREYPHAMVHVMSGPSDLQTPQQMHPVFFGSFDWHSCVHGFWQLARLKRMFPTLPQSNQIESLFDSRLTPENTSIELRYFQRPESRSFERPYGWAWLLMLASELEHHANGNRWRQALIPLAQLISQRFIEFLPKAAYPIRAGVHSNTAFALSLAHRYALTFKDEALRSQIETSAMRWYFEDHDCQAWEPSLDDFLSPALMEAECMRRLLPTDQFKPWLSRFLPRLRDGKPQTLFDPVTPSDRTDGKIAHLDGLNLSRAWCWRGIASVLSEDDPLKSIALAAADKHLAQSLPHLSGDYAGEHWLASFALLAMSEI